MIEVCNRLSVKENVDNNDLYSIYSIKLIEMPEFRELYDHNSPGIPTRNNKSPEKKYTLCNVRTMLRAYEVREILHPQEWQRKIFFFGTRTVNNISAYFPLLDFTNGVMRQGNDLFKLHDEIKHFNDPDLWTSRAIVVAVY